MQNKTYNGWTNHATWLVNLWWGDDLFEMDIKDAEAIQDFVEDIAQDSSNTAESRFVSDMVYGYLAEVNWNEIAESVGQK